MEKIPREINRVLSDIVVELQELLDITKGCAVGDDTLKKVQAIDEIRKRLSVVDFSYEDCYTILVGYMRYQTEKRLAEMKAREQNNGQQPNGQSI